MFVQAAAGRTRVMASARPAVRNVRPRAEFREHVTRPTRSHDGARGREPVASIGGITLLQPFAMELAAALLPARDLARVCATSSQHRGHAAALAHAALDAQHGLALPKNAILASMHSLDGVPDTLTIVIGDDKQADLLSRLDETVAFLREHLVQRRRNVLVHCGAGISRSGGAVVAWLMVRHGIGRDEALARVQRARQWVRPNDGFMAQLAAYENALSK